jgi:hypothetical protein
MSSQKFTLARLQGHKKHVLAHSLAGTATHPTHAALRSNNDCRIWRRMRRTRRTRRITPKTPKGFDTLSILCPVRCPGEGETPNPVGPFSTFCPGSWFPGRHSLYPNYSL